MMRIAAWLCSALLGGCAALPPGPPLPAIDAPLAFRESAPTSADAAPAEAAADGAWWKVFNDAALDGLVERALGSHANASVEAAAARLAQARAALGAAAAARTPQVGLGGAANRQGGPLVNAAGAEGNLASVVLSASYEPDLFARQAAARDAAQLDVQARADLLQATRLSVAADVTQTYLALGALDAERALARAAALAQHEALRIAEGRLRSGSLAELDLARLRSEAAAVDAEVPLLARRRAELEHALAALLGLAPAQFSSDELPFQTDRIALPPQIPAGIPSQLLARRPDVAATQRAVLAAQARAGIARAAWVPSLALTASAGHASADLVELLHASTRAWGLGAVLALPIFDGGRREAGVRQADAELALQVAAHRAQVLAALREVEDQLSALRGLAAELALHAQAAAAADRAVALAESRYRNGLASQLDLLDTRRTALRGRRLALQTQAAQMQATVALIKALGGGWGDTAVPLPQAAGAS